MSSFHQPSLNPAKLTLLLFVFIFSCRGDDSVPNDSRRPLLIAKSWELATDDIVDTSGGRIKYLSRIAPACNQRLRFFDNDSLSTIDNCQNAPAKQTAGGWTWSVPFLNIVFNTAPGSPYFQNIRFFSLSRDTFQIIVQYDGDVDSLRNEKTLRVKTYLGK